MNIVNSLGVLSGLQLNEKKTKVLWIGASRKNKIEPLKFQRPKDPLELTFPMMRLPTTTIFISK